MTRTRAQLILVTGLVAGIAATGAFAACLPAYTFGSESLADASGDAVSVADGNVNVVPDASLDGAGPPSGDSSSPVDASLDGGSRDAAPSHNDGSLVPAAVVSAGTAAFATGFGYQLHLVFAQNDGRYWFFYADGTAGVVKATASRDLITWTAEASVPLTSGFSLADGDDFSVAYANVGSTDVVHFVVNANAGSNYTAFHIRATISGGALHPAAPVALPDTNSGGSAGSSGGSCPQAGPATIVASDGHVWDVTAWTGHSGNTTCDTNIYLSPGVDTGASWNTGAFTHDGYFVSVPTYAFAHDLVELPEAGVVLAVWPDEDNSAVTQFDSIGWALSTTFDGAGVGATGVFPDASAELFAGLGANASYDDWSICRLRDTDVHLMRHTTGSAGNSVGAFQEVVYDGTSWQSTAAPPTTVTSLSNTGVVLLSDESPADGMLLVSIGVDNAINIQKWVPGGSWTPLTSIPGTTQRQSLGGSGCGNAHPAVFWTEGASAPYAILRADLSSLLGP